MEAAPFSHRSELVRRAVGYTRDALEERARDGASELEHPLSAARLLDEAGFDDEVVAAGVLHDVVEDTATDIADIERDFGADVAFLVTAMTEDRTIEDYGERKADHRSRIVQAGPRAAAIFAADKLAKVRELQSKPTEPPERKVGHYRRSLQTLRDAYPDLPFLGELEVELDQLVESRRASATDASG
jgi:(p)ppGpp synthase/HD superfamily hydrolase